MTLDNMTGITKGSCTGQGGDAEVRNDRTYINEPYMQHSRHDDGKDLISRADAVEAVAYAIWHYPNECYKNLNDFDMEEALAKDALFALTSADRPSGEWIKKQVFNPERDMYVPLIECSVCGYEPYYGGSESKFNYCANCGADMRKGEK